MIPEYRATTVSVLRGTTSDHLQSVTQICFIFPSDPRPNPVFTWKSVTVEGQLGADGEPLTIVPVSSGVIQPVRVVGSGPKQCQQASFQDTSRMPYHEGDHHQPTDDE